MVVVQKLKEAEITELDSLLLTSNLLRIAIFNSSYIRSLFLDKYFNDKSVPALEMKVKKLMPVDEESRRLIDWMEKGVYDALQKYLKTLLFCACEDVEGPMIEEYTFSFNCSNSDSQEVSMNINRSGNKKQAKRQPQEDNCMNDEASDDTQDSEEDEHQFSWIKDWISSCHIDTVKVTDVLLKFLEICAKY